VKYMFKFVSFLLKISGKLNLFPITGRFFRHYVNLTLTSSNGEEIASLTPTNFIES